MDTIIPYFRDLKQSIKSATGKNVWIRYVFLALWRLVCTAAAQVSGKAHSGQCAINQQNYAERVFLDYKRWAGINRFYGHAAEVGPGNVSALGLMLLADGCLRVDMVDRYSYRIENGSPPALCRYQMPAEEFFLSHRGYDFILSCAVMEHLYDPLAALRAMAKALNPGGVMIHAVDCRDHGQFSDHLHDLSFLQIPPLLYFPLAAGTGLNRIRVSDYRRTLESLGFNCRIFVTSLSGVPEGISPAAEFDKLDPSLIHRSSRNLYSIKNKLAKPFRDMNDRDLMISGFSLVARK
jgi:SAM-dependent methyltransferase